MTEWLSFFGFSAIINNMNKLFWKDEMTDSNKVKKVEKDSIKIGLDSSINLSEKIKLGQNTTAISVLSDTFSNFQATVNSNIISGLIATSNVLSSAKLVNFANLTTPLVSLPSLIQVEKALLMSCQKWLIRTIKRYQVHTCKQFKTLQILQKI